LFWTGFGVLKERELSHNMMQAAAQCFLKITKGIFLYRILFIMDFFPSKKLVVIWICESFPGRFKALLWPNFSLPTCLFLKIQSLRNCPKTASLLIFCPSQSRRGGICRFFISNQKSKTQCPLEKSEVLCNF